MEQQGVTVEVESELNKGRTFSVYLPENYGKDLE